MIDETQIKTEREMWAEPGDLDKTITALGPSVRLHMRPGEYFTSGFIPPKTFIWDAPQGNVTVWLRDNAPERPEFRHQRRILYMPNWSNFISINGITLDGNYENQPGATSGEFKVDPLVLQALQIKVVDCTVRNFGASGRDHPDGWECFPLSVTTVPNGDHQFYVPAQRALAGHELEPSRVEVLNCVVEKPHFRDGGYCTGIFVRTNLGTNAGDRQEMGTRTTQAGIVSGCRVNVPGGGCYGCADAEMVTWENNDGIGMSLFNLDTLRGQRLTIRNNRGLGVNQGINVAPSGGGSKILVEGNLIVLTDPWKNDAGTAWGIRGCWLTDDCAANRNFILRPAVWPGRVVIGIYGSGNIVENKIESGISEAAYAKLVDDLQRANILVARMSGAIEALYKTNWTA